MTFRLQCPKHFISLCNAIPMHCSVFIYI